MAVRFFQRKRQQEWIVDQLLKSGNFVKYLHVLRRGPERRLVNHICCQVVVDLGLENGQPLETVCCRLTVGRDRDSPAQCIRYGI